MQAQHKLEELRLAAQEGINSISAYMTLVAISEAPVPISYIIKHTFLGGANLTGICDNLVKRGLATRENNPDDRREILVKITAKGMEILKKLNITANDTPTHSSTHR